MQRNETVDTLLITVLWMMMMTAASHTQNPEQDEVKELDLCPLSPSAMDVDSGSAQGWKKLDFIVDSGAAHSVMDGDTMPGIRRETSEASQKGQVYVGPGQERIPNRGQKRYQVRTKESNLNKAMTIQDAKVRKPLAAVSGIVGKDNGVFFDKHQSAIIPANAPELKLIRELVQKAKNRIDLEEKRGVFVMPVWIRTEDEDVELQPFLRQGR